VTGDRTDPEREDWQSYKLLGEAGGDRLGAVLQGSIVTSTAAGSDAGSVYLINENDYAAADAADGTVDGVIDLVHVPDLARSYMLYGAAAGDAAGSKVSDTFIGAPGADLGGSDAGAIYTYSADDLSRLDAMDGTMDHRIDLGDFSSTDHIVEGTEGDDHLERYAYRGDPTLDMVGNGDAADGSDDDVIRALGGDDFITSSAGSDSIDGGEGTDTYAARSLDIYRLLGATEFLGAFDSSGAGDVDGDGLGDILVGNTDAGAAYLISGSSLIAPQGGADGIVDLVALSGEPGNHHLTNLALGAPLSSAMTSVGDIDGDGNDDVALWPAPWTNAPEPTQPATILTSSFLAGAPNEIDMSGVAGQPGVISFIGGAGYTGGYAMANIGDAVGDASVDVLIALTDADVGGATNAGIVYLIDGDQLGILAGSDGVIDLSAIEGRAGVTTFLGTNDGSREVRPGDDISSASSVIGLSSGGDVDGDGKSDILIGMPFHDAIPQPLGPKSAGEAYLVTSTALGTASGATAGGITIDLGDMPSADGDVTFTAPEPVAGTGWDVSLASDIDGDGFDDILIGTPSLYFFGDGSPAAGGVYLVTSQHLRQGTGTDPATIPAQTVDLATIAGQDGSIAFEVVSGLAPQFWGSKIAPMGDLDGDGRDEFLLGASGVRTDQTGPTNRTGQTCLLNGADLTETNLPDGTYELHTNQASPVLIGPDNRSYYFDGWRNFVQLGAVVTSAGDVDGDGRDDILVGDQFGGVPFLVHAADLVELDATTNDNETSPKPPPIRDFRGTIRPPIPQSETLDVTILSATDGSATANVHKVDLGATDGVTSIEVFRAGEGLAEADRIDFTALGGLRSGQIGLSEADREAAGGTYTPEGGPAIAFGPSAAVTLADILADPATYGEGRVEITDGAESGTLDGVAFENFETIEFGIIRFAADVAIAVPGGTVPAGRLAVGDLVLTADRGAQPIRWIGRRVLGPAELAARPNLRPIRICAGALGGGLPRRAMLVSPQHRMLIATPAAKRAFGAAEVLVPARALLGLPGVAVAEDLDGIRYVHFLCDRHEVVFAEGAPSESLLPGPQALRSLAPAPRAELLALFPLLARSGPGLPARPLVDRRRGAWLATQLPSRPGTLLPAAAADRSAA
jgi:hypothetical protein